MAGAKEFTPDKLKKRKQFLAVQRGERHRGRYFLLETLSRDDVDEPRFGITVTRKQGNAVERNRIRRRLTEAIRMSEGRDMRPGNDYVVVGRRDILSAPFEELKAELRTRLKKASKQSNKSAIGAA